MQGFLLSLVDPSGLTFLKPQRKLGFFICPQKQRVTDLFYEIKFKCPEIL
jgi:hypothetical protein